MEKIMETPNVFGVAKKYVNKWVALSEDRKKVVAHGKTLSEVLKKVSSENRVMVFRVLPNLTYVPSQFRELRRR